MPLQRDSRSVQENAKLKVLTVLNGRSTVMNIPSKLFGAAFAVSVFALWKAPLIFGVPFVTAVFAPLYLIHLDDPYGLETLMDSIHRPLCYEAASIEPLQLVLVRERQAAFHFDDPRKPVKD